LIGIAVGDPINRVNLLYLIDVDRIHRIDRTRDVGSIDPDPVYRLIRASSLARITWPTSKHMLAMRAESTTATHRAWQLAPPAGEGTGEGVPAALVP